MIVDRMNLPDVVRQRLGAVLGEPTRGLVASVQGRLEEERLSTRIERRATDDGTFGVEGYATTWDVAYEVAGGPPWGWVEIMCTGACTKALQEKDDVRFLVNHDGVALARTKSKTMTLEADNIGLRVDAPSLDLRNPTAQELQSALERGDLDEMSLAMRVTRQEWNGDYTERRILEVRLFDVSAVTFPANTATALQIARADEIPAEVGGSGLALARAQADALRFRRPRV